MFVNPPFTAIRDQMKRRFKTEHDFNYEFNSDPDIPPAVRVLTPLSEQRSSITESNHPLFRGSVLLADELERTPNCTCPPKR